ncbi:MAG: DUF5011 domain-containing protein [Fusicatenibacter sp.]|nr:DUF5011 domain-containing protein [Fusicatenibacter sp.]
MKRKKKTPEKTSHLKRILYGMLAVILVFTGLSLITGDYQPPEITGMNQTVEYGTKLTVPELANIKDNCSDNLETAILTENQAGLTIDYDDQFIIFEDVGSYEIELSAKDEAGNEGKGKVLVEVQDKKAPELLPFPTDIQIGYNQETALCLNAISSEDSICIQAEDKSEISACIEEIKNIDQTEVSPDAYILGNDQSSVRFRDLGTYLLTFRLKDEYGNSVTGNVTVDVIDRTSPDIVGLKTEYVLSESDNAPDYLEGVTATDEIDGDITSAISLDAVNISYGVVGEYAVVYQVSDAAGNTCRKEIPVIIKDSTPPVISLQKSSFTLTVGDSKPDYLSGISATDAIDGDVSKNITVDDSGVDYNTPGSYTVSCRVVDSSGNAASQIITVVLKAVQQEKVSESDSSGGETVLITKTGECYHTHKCGNGTYFPVTLSEALRRGLRPCKKCY